MDETLDWSEPLGVFRFDCWEDDQLDFSSREQFILPILTTTMNTLVLLYDICRRALCQFISYHSVDFWPPLERGMRTLKTSLSKQWFVQSSSSSSLPTSAAVLKSVDCFTCTMLEKSVEWQNKSFGSDGVFLKSLEVLIVWTKQKSLKLLHTLNKELSQYLPALWCSAFQC